MRSIQDINIGDLFCSSPDGAYEQVQQYDIVVSIDLKSRLITTYASHYNRFETHNIHTYSRFEWYKVKEQQEVHDV